MEVTMIPVPGVPILAWIILVLVGLGLGVAIGN
jgi:hypothetical protein